MPENENCLNLSKKLLNQNLNDLYHLYSGEHGEYLEHTLFEAFRLYKLIVTGYETIKSHNLMFL